MTLSGIALRSTRAAHRTEQLDAIAAREGAPREKIETAKRHIGKAATVTARDYQEGRIAIPIATPPLPC